MVARAHSYIPDKGDIVWLDFDPQTGHEQAGRRPAVVLSVGAYNGTTGLALVCPVTNRSKGYPYEVGLPPETPVTGVVLADHVKSVDWQARRAAFIGKVGQDVLDQILDRVAAIL
jgi:mRNA interferase MazF